MTRSLHCLLVGAFWLLLVGAVGCADEGLSSPQPEDSTSGEPSFRTNFVGAPSDLEVKPTTEWPNLPVGSTCGSCKEGIIADTTQGRRCLDAEGHDIRKLDVGVGDFCDDCGQAYWSCTNQGLECVSTEYDVSAQTCVSMGRGSLLVDRTEVRFGELEQIAPDLRNRFNARLDESVDPARYLTLDAMAYLANRRSEVQGLELCYDLLDCGYYEYQDGSRGHQFTCVGFQEVAETCTGWRLPSLDEAIVYTGADTMSANEMHNALTPAEYAWLSTESTDIQPVGMKHPNRFGIFDTYGNLREVSASRNGAYYTAGCSFQDRSVERCWQELRSLNSGEVNHDVGFRLVRTLSP